jgi:hypothetical protein
MTEQEFLKLQSETSKFISDTFNKSTLRRSTTSKAAMAHLRIFDTQVEKILANPNLTKSQYFDLHNQIQDQTSGYTGSIIKKEKIIGQEKDKIFRKDIRKKLIKKQELAPISKVLRKAPIRSINVTNNLINSLGGFVVEGKKTKPTGKAITSYDIIKAQGDKVNFNLKGYALFENSAYNAKIHGVSQTFSEIDEAIKNKKISVSEANKLKAVLQDKGVAAKITQFGEQEQVKQFNRPEYQKVFKNFLGQAFKKYMRVIPVVGPLFMLKDMKKQYEQIMEGEHPMFPSAEKLSQQVFKKGGKVKPKPKPYAMGGKVYSNSIRKPKLI